MPRLPLQVTAARRLRRGLWRSNKGASSELAGLEEEQLGPRQPEVFPARIAHAWGHLQP